MNTKILLLSIAVSLVLPLTISAGAFNQKQLLSIEMPAASKTVPDNNKQQDKSTDWTLAWPYDELVHHHSPDDDGKSHHFHYDRLCRTRRRIVLICILKILLILIHTSSFMYSAIHFLR